MTPGSTNPSSSPQTRPPLDLSHGVSTDILVAFLDGLLSPEEAQELWERLSVRDLIPQEWLFSFSREFRLQGRLGLHPLSIKQAASLALAPQVI